MNETVTFDEQLHRALEFEGVGDVGSEDAPASALRVIDRSDHDAAVALWEYLTTYGGSNSTDAERRLNALGAEGWELVSVVPPHDPSGQTVLYLKRPRTG